MIWSTTKKNSAAAIAMANTLAVVTISSLRVGQLTLESSWRTSRTNCAGDVLAMTLLLILPCSFGRQAAGSLAGVEGLEPPTPGFGDRALPVEPHLILCPNASAARRPGWPRCRRRVLSYALLPPRDKGSGLLDDGGDDAGADGAAASRMAKREPCSKCRNRRDQLDLHGDVVARHHHLGALRQLDRPGHVRGPKEELRPVVGEERRSAARPPPWSTRRSRPLNWVCGVIEPGLHSTWPRSTSSRLTPRNSTPTLSPGSPVRLAKRSRPRAHRLLGRLDAHDLDLVADVNDPALDPPGHHRAAAR